MKFINIATTCFFLFLFFLFRSNLLFSQFYSDHELSESQIMKDISNGNVLLSFSYEPGFEDGSALAYYRFKFGVKTYSVFLTRGEGSENDIGNERYQELGAIRTKESIKSSKIIGTENYFLNLFDFGETKDPEILLKKWGGKDSVIKKLVYIIRFLRPDVIIYGNRSAPNNIANFSNLFDLVLPEAIKKASDPKFAIESILNKYSMPWQVKRLFKNTETVNKNKNRLIQLPNTEKCDYFDKTYQEIASLSIAEYKSISREDREKLIDFQSKNRYLMTYNITKGQENITDFFDNKTNSFRNSKRLYDFIEMLKKIKRNEREKTLEILTDLDILVDFMKKEMIDKKTFDPLKDRILTNLKFKINDLKIKALGVKIKKKFSDSAICQRQVSFLQFDSIYTASEGKTSLVFLNTDKDWALISGTQFSNNFSIKNGDKIQIVLPENIQLTQPAYLHQYQSMSDDFIMKYVIVHNSKERKFNFQYFSYEKFDIVPKAIFEVTPKSVYLSKDRIFDYSLTHYLHDGVKKVAPRISNSEAGTSYSDTFNIENKYESKSGVIKFTLADSLKNGAHNLFFTIGKPIYSKVTAKKFDCKVSLGVKIGIFPRIGSETIKLLTDLKISYKILLFNQNLDLSDYSTIIFDENVLKNGLPAELESKINEYVEKGGNLLILSQNTSLFQNLQKIDICNLNIEFSENMVLNESSNIIISDTSHIYFKYPNKIFNQDWNGWIQERGKYFPDKYSKDFQELISIAEPNGKRINSGILFCERGKGTITSISLSLDRQIYSVTEGVYKLFANIISIKKN